MLKRISFLSLALLLLLAALSFNVSADPTLPKTSVKEEPITVGYSRLRISLPIFVAAQKGIFTKHGLNIRLEAYDTALPMIQALAENKIDIAGYSALPIIFSAMNRSEKSFYFVTKLLEDQNHRISYFLRPKSISEKKPTINSIVDLKGKRVGILPTNAYRAWIVAMAAEHGLKVGRDFTVQLIDPAQQAITLKSGGVDALFTNDPVATAIIAKEIGELVSGTVECPQYFEDPFVFGSFVIAKKWADKHPSETWQLVAALHEAVDFIKDNQSEAKQLMIPYMSDQFKSHVDLYPDARYEYLEKSDRKHFSKIVSDYVKLKILDKPTNLKNLLLIKR